MVTGITARMGQESDLTFFELRFQPNLEQVSIVRQFVGAFYLRVLRDADLVSRVALATHELLENAVKYASGGESQLRMEVRMFDGHPRVEVITRNQALPDHARVLLQRIDEMTSSGDPFHFYQNLMRRSARTMTAGGLGLGRIAAEGEMVLSGCYEDHVVEVRACANRTVHP